MPMSKDPVNKSIGLEGENEYTCTWVPRCMFSYNLVLVCKIKGSK